MTLVSLTSPALLFQLIANDTHNQVDSEPLFVCVCVCVFIHQICVA